MIFSHKNIAPTKKNGFLVIEGVNGAGKTTVKAHMLDRLKEKKIDYLDTYEPGDSPLGKNLRELLLGSKRDIKSNLAELFLFAADRAEHVERVIRPTLQAGKLVICDRYYYSMLAFQGYGRGHDLKLIENLNQLAIANTYPDFVLLLDIDPAVGLQRNKKSEVQGNTFSVDAMEKEELAFHQRIRGGFLEIAKNVKEDVVIVDASRALESVLADVDSLMDLYLV